MDDGSRVNVRRGLALFNLVSIVLIVPAILHHYIFRMPPSEAPGSRTVLIVGLAVVWGALAARPVVTPSGRPWPFPLRAAVFLGGDLSMALLMFLLHRS